MYYSIILLVVVVGDRAIVLIGEPDREGLVNARGTRTTSLRLGLAVILRLGGLRRRFSIKATPCK